jgi:predicted GIY-YIG superfamily endonuclease
MKKPHVLYRAFDAKGQLLYVGITMNPGSRFAQHSEKKPWWVDVADIRVEQFASRDEVLTAEREAIKSELPLHNVAHSLTNKPNPTQRAKSYRLQIRKRRRPRGSGRVRQLPSGRWQAAIMNADKTYRLASQTFITRFDAERWLDQQTRQPIKPVNIFENFDSLPGWSA